MCLSVNVEKTKKFSRKGKVKIKIKKQVRINDELILTPYRYTAIEAGWLKAEFPIERVTVKNGYASASRIEGGAIHAYIGDDKLSPAYETLDCWAYAEDYIASGNVDICFKKIWIPIEEIERLEKKLARRKRDRERRERRKS